PRPTVPQRAGGTRRRTPLVVAATVVVAIATATALILTLGTGTGGTGDTGGNKAGATTDPSAKASTPTPSDRKTPPAPSPSQKTPTRTPTPKPGNLAGRWIAQLHSEPVSAGLANRDRRLTTIRRSVPQAKVLRSDDFASLRGGYWVFYAPGPFPNGRAALSFCAEHDRTTVNSCIGRYLSKNPKDFDLQCRPPASAPTGTCTRKNGNG
ncbi:serine/threonine protein kinase, partial [Streptomyces sp. WAC 05379]